MVPTLICYILLDGSVSARRPDPFFDDMDATIAVQWRAIDGTRRVMGIAVPNEPNPYKAFHAVERHLAAYWAVLSITMLDVTITRSKK